MLSVDYSLLNSLPPFIQHQRQIQPQHLQLSTTRNSQQIEAPPNNSAENVLLHRDRIEAGSHGSGAQQVTRLARSTTRFLTSFGDMDGCIGV